MGHASVIARSGVIDRRQHVPSTSATAMKAANAGFFRHNLGLLQKKARNVTSMLTSQ